MQALTIEIPRRTISLIPNQAGDIEILADPYLRGGGQQKTEEKILIIPKSERARIAHFLATGEAIE